MAKRKVPTFKYPSRPTQRRRTQSFLGQKDNQEASVIGDFKAELAENCDFEINKNQGRTTLKNRLGYTKFGNSAVGAEECVGGSLYNYISGGSTTKSLFAAFNSGSSAVVFKHSASGDWIEQTGASAMTVDTDIVFQNANNSLYLYNGQESVRKYNNTTWSELSSGAPMSGAGDIGKYAVWAKNINHVAGLGNYPSRVYLSATTDPEDFTAENFVSLNPGDGYGITGLGTLSNFVVAYKTKGIYLLSGYEPSRIAAAPVQRSKHVGCLSHYSIAEGQNGQGVPVSYFFGNGRNGTGAIYMFDTVNVIRISDDIQETLDGLNKAKLSIASGVWDGEKYKLAVAYGASTVNNYELVYYPDINQWVVNTGKRPAHYFEYSGSDDVSNVYFGDAANSGLVYQDNSGTLDNDSFVSFHWKGKAQDSGEPYQDKKFKTMWISTNVIGDTQLSGFASVDSGQFISIPAISLSAGNQWGTGAIDWGDGTKWGGSTISKHRLGLNVRGGKTIQLELKSEQSAGIHKIYEFETYYKPKKIK